MSNPQKAEFSLQYGIYFYMRNLTFHSIIYKEIGSKLASGREFLCL